MKIAIIQISDIHIESTGDVAHRYLPQAASVFNEVSFPNVDAVVLLLCGDIAYSGAVKEYAAFAGTLNSLKSEILRTSGHEPHIIAMPGNHDCDLSLDDAVRRLLIESIPREGTKLSDGSVVAQCIKVQKPFWNFVWQSPFRRPEVNADGIYIEHRIKVGNQQVRFRCYNTAWVSQNPEEPGRMALPRAYFNGHDTESRLALSVSVLHHPSHWLTPNRKREFDIVLDHASDLVLFGHEHLPEEYTKSDFNGNRVGYIFGGVFQRNPNDCPGEFNAIVVDLDIGAHNIRRYKRNGKSFERFGDHDDWIPLGLRTPELVAGFRLSRQQIEFLEDPEIEFAHRSGKRLSLDDIFINPDFTILSAERGDVTNEEGKWLRGEGFDAFLRENKKSLILGRERSGRTSLAKKVFWTLYREGLVPVFVNGERLKGNAIKDVDEVVKNALFAAYDNPQFPAFDQTDCGKRAIVIDGFERSRLGARGRAALLKHLEAKFDVIVAFGDPLMFVEEVTSGIMLEQSLPDFVRLEIRELGRSARRRLIRRWHSIGAQNDLGVVEERVVESERIIDTLLGRSFLPAYPVFVLSFLQSIESSRPMDNIGSYGYHYEAFITNALSRHAQEISLDIKYQFLSELAYRLFSTETTDVDDLALKMFYDLFCEKYGIAPDRGLLITSLLESRLLELYGGVIRFKYAYAYYFFVARYFRDHLAQDEIKTHIRRLSQNFHVEQNSNIWIFLAHLSKSEFLISVILEEAAKLFPTFNPITLEDDATFLRELGDFSHTLLLPDSSPEENTEKHYDKLDKIDAGASKLEGLDDPEGRDILRKIDAMVRTILVLGQVLKNFPGSLTAVEKFEVVNAGFNLGLRGLAFILKTLEDGKEELVQFFAERIAEKYDGSPSDDALKKKIRYGLFWIVRLNVFGMIKLMSHGLGAKGEDATYTKVVNALGTKAARLIDVSISLDTLKVPRQRIFALYEDLRDDLLNRHLLVSLVVRHLYLFPVPHNVKDELCRKLGIAVEKLDRAEAALGEHTKRIGPPQQAKRLKSGRVDARKFPQKGR